MRALSLFTGAGGLDYGLHQAGVETVAVCEFEPKCHPVIEARFPGVEIHKDVTTIRRKWNVDLIHGGPPCQDNSVAKQGGEGIRGKKSGLVFDMLAIIETSKPSAVLIENVMGLVGRGLWEVCAHLRGLGYGVEVTRIRASDMGLPHRRERLLILGHLGLAAPGGVDSMGGRWTRVERKCELARWRPSGVPASSLWGTPLASDNGRKKKFAQGGTPLSAMVRNWPTPVATDFKGSNKPGARRGTLSEAVPDAAGWTGIGPLNPDWTDALMGWPIGWTDQAATIAPLPGAVMGRGPLQHGWEPARMVAPGSVRGRPARIKMGGNGVVNGVGQVGANRIREVREGLAAGESQIRLF